MNNNHLLEIKPEADKHFNRILKTVNKNYAFVQDKWDTNGTINFVNDKCENVMFMEYAVVSNEASASIQDKEVYKKIIKSVRDIDLSKINSLPLVHISNIKFEDDVTGTEIYEAINKALTEILNDINPDLVYKCIVCVDSDYKEEFTKLYRGYLKAPAGYKLASMGNYGTMLPYVDLKESPNQNSIYIVESNEELYYDLLVKYEIAKKDNEVFKAIIDKLNKDNLDVSELYEEAFKYGETIKPEEGVFVDLSASNGAVTLDPYDFVDGKRSPNEVIVATAGEGYNYNH